MSEFPFCFGLVVCLFLACLLAVWLSLKDQFLLIPLLGVVFDSDLGDLMCHYQKQKSTSTSFSFLYVWILSTSLHFATNNPNTNFLYLDNCNSHFIDFPRFLVASLNPGFLNFSTIDIWGRITPCHGSGPGGCPVHCGMLASLTSPHHVKVMSFPCPPW